MDVGTTIVELSLPVGTIPPGRVLRETNSTIEFVPSIDPNAPETLPVWLTRTEDEDLFVEATREATGVAGLTVLDRQADPPLYRLAWEHPPPCPSLFSPQLLIEHVEGRPDGWWFRLLVSDMGVFRALSTEASDRGTEIDLRRTVVEHRRTDGNGLTECQREILRIALENGYFEIPRRSTLGEIADVLDISHQAASERLRRAYRALSENAIRVPDG